MSPDSDHLIIWYYNNICCRGDTKYSNKYGLLEERESALVSTLSSESMSIFFLTFFTCCNADIIYNAFWTKSINIVWQKVQNKRKYFPINIGACQCLLSLVCPDVSVSNLETNPPPPLWLQIALTRFAKINNPPDYSRYKLVCPNQLRKFVEEGGAEGGQRNGNYSGQLLVLSPECVIVMA